MEIFKLSHFHWRNCRELACTLLKLDVLQELVWYWTLCRNKALIFCGLALRGSLDIFHTSYTLSTGHHCVLPTAFTTTKPYTENCKSWSPSCHADWSHIRHLPHQPVRQLHHLRYTLLLGHIDSAVLQREIHFSVPQVIYVNGTPKTLSVSHFTTCLSEGERIIIIIKVST